jgi:hypothetical protein
MVVTAAGPPDDAPLHWPQSSTYATVHWVPTPTDEGSTNVARVSLSTCALTVTFCASVTDKGLSLLAVQLSKTRAGATNRLPVTATVSPARPYLD